MVKWMNLTVCLPHGPVSIPSHGGVFQGIFPWLITLCQPILIQRGRKWLNLSPMALHNPWTSRKKADIQPWKTMAERIYRHSDYLALFYHTWASILLCPTPCLRCMLNRHSLPLYRMTGTWRKTVVWYWMVAYHFLLTLWFLAICSSLYCLGIMEISIFCAGGSITTL